MSTPVLPAAYRLTYADWVEFPEDGPRYQIIDGELFGSLTPSIRHQDVSGNLYSYMRRHLKETNRGRIFYAPTRVRLSDERIVEPDLLVVLSEHSDLIGTQIIEGAPDLVVEILSPGTAGRDLVMKHELYERAGVAEYWIVDVEAGNIEVLALERGKSDYARSGLLRRGETCGLPCLPELTIPLDEVFE
ncbi:Uma2 family endonuclease [soil metagenome]